MKAINIMDLKKIEAGQLLEEVMERDR